MSFYEHMHVPDQALSFAVACGRHPANRVGWHCIVIASGIHL